MFTDINYFYGSELKEKRPYPPCRAACPIHIDIQSYIGLIGQGRYDEAFEVIRSVNPIASTCSVICYHPCEQACRRSDVDEPLAIRHLKRFAMEQSLEYRRSKCSLIPQTKTERIAIIGSGPSGLTAANDLVDLGYSVTLYEKYPVLGGMLAAAIPPYRLPRSVLTDDIDDILAKGVMAKTGVEVGKDVGLDDLISQYDAVLLAIGLAKSLSLSIPGVEGPGVRLALDFLEDIAFGRAIELGNQILIIGGGNVAVDAARSVRRLGYEHVDMVCMESPKEMPAWDWEVYETIEEGIRIFHQQAPRAIRRNNGRIEGLETVKVKSVYDENGRFKPVYDDTQTSFIAADTLIISIGRREELSFLKNSQITINADGHIEWNKHTHQTSIPSVFVSGEVAAGPCPAIRAVANGRRAGKAIHLYLQGKNIPALIDDQEKEIIRRLPEDVRMKIAKQARERIGVLAPEIRITGFSQYEKGYDELSALKEARRCRTCGSGAVVDPGRCCGCLTCFRICPYGTPMVTHRANMLVEKCQACGLCAAECPAKAISMVYYDVNELIARMPEIVGSPDPKREHPIIVAFLCHYHSGIQTTAFSPGIRPIRIHCISRISVQDLLAAFQCGADGVFVAGREADCKYKNIVQRVLPRIEHTQHLLDEIGIGGERLAWFETGANPEESWLKAAEEMTLRITKKQKKP